MPIVATARTVAELFSDLYRFLLPYFQRGYAWEEQHALRLLNDILDAAEGRKPISWYPLGSIIVAKTSDDPNAWLADGHQRLITLTILLAVLRDLERDPQLKARLDAGVFHSGLGSATAEPRVITQSAARGCLADYVLAAGATAKPFDDEKDAVAGSETNIIGNRDLLRREIAAMSAARRRTFANFLLDGCIVVVMAVESQDVARLLFSTMHDTGTKPTTADLFKAQVLGEIEPDLREAAQTTWESHEALLGREKLEMLLRQIAIIQRREQPKRQIEAILEETFKLDQPAGALQFIEQHFRPIGRHLIDVTSAPLAAGSLAPAAQRRLQYLSWVRNHETWLAPVLHWLQSNSGDGLATIEFLRRIEALAWVNTILGVEPKRREERYMDLLAEISDGRALKPGSVLEINPNEVTEVRSILLAPRFTKQRRYKNFLLLRANAAMEGDDRVTLLPDATVEHVFPKRPGTGSQWLRDFNSPAAVELRHGLGNLALLNGADQNHAKNSDFAAKRLVFAGSEFVMTRLLSEASAWTPGDVRRRTEALIAILLKSWGLA